MADSKAFQKKANISLVMQQIRVKKRISRIDISRELGLDRSTITNIVNKLIEGQLILEVEEGSSVSRGGRKPVLLGINSNFGVVLGLEIQNNHYRATLMTLDGIVKWNKSGNTSGSNNLYKVVDDICKENSESIKIDQPPLLGIGIGIPGHIDPVENEIKQSSYFYREEGYKEDFKNFFDIPVVLDNDANCCAWGVLEERKENKPRNYLYSILEKDDHGIYKVGFGIVVCGNIYYGSNFAAGEFWDDYLEDPKNYESSKDFFKNLIDKLSLFISFLNPSHLFLGGEFLQFKEVVTQVVEDSTLGKTCSVEFSNKDEFDVSYGAASMLVERLFKTPGLDTLRTSELTWDNMLKLHGNKI